MTEAEWRGAFDLEGVLWNLEKGLSVVLPDQPSERKLRLFAVACVRHLLGVGGAKQNVVLDEVEGFADARTNHERSRIHAIREAAHALFRGPEVSNPPGSQVLFDALVRRLPTKAAHDTNARCRSFDSGAGDNARRLILLDTLGNPFRPVAVDPSWLTSTVVALAEGIYAERAFDRMPILADALQDAGCEHPDILSHCRGNGPHVKGCWVVDLLTGRK